jgi:transcriptional regulator GlxA family with amidase domain
VVVPAIRGSERCGRGSASHLQADLVMSVCTGVPLGALACRGREATTHHEFWDDFEKEFPAVRLRRGPRWVEGPKVATAGGLTSGIDLALRVVERYFGRDTAQATAEYMEYRGDGWRG